MKIKPSYRQIWALLFSMILFVTLTGVQTNKSQHSGQVDEDSYTKEELIKKIKDQLITPIYATLKKTNPNLGRMTKCYTKLDFEINGKKQFEALNKPEELETTHLKGTIFLIDCGRYEHICEYKLILSTDELKVRESILGKWTTLEVLLQKIEESKPEKP